MSSEGLWASSLTPHGRWLAYMARRPGQWQVYVRPSPGPGAPVPVSVDGGKNPAWNPRGGELVFSSAQTRDGTSLAMAADFFPGPPPRAGTPRRRFEFDAGTLQFRCEPVRCCDVAADGQRFCTVERKLTAFPAPVSHVNYAPNWFDELRAKVPPR